MKVIREKSILGKIDEEINKKSLPDIIRIDLDEGEFEKFLRCFLKDQLLSLSYEGELRNPLLSTSITNYSVVYKRCKWLGSFVVYRGVSVQCCYEEE